MVIDQNLDHLHKCRHQGIEAVTTHNRLLGVLKQLMCFVTKTAIHQEPRHKFAQIIADSGLRLDLTFTSMEGGREYGYDAVITHPIPVDLTHNQAGIPRRAAAIAEKKKIAKYGDLCRATNTSFTPWAVETGGIFGELCQKEFYRLCDLHPRGGHQSFRQYWLMRISIAVQTGVSNAVLNRKRVLMNKSKRKLNGGVLPDNVDVMLDCTYANITGYDPGS